MVTFQVKDVDGRILRERVRTFGEAKRDARQAGAGGAVVAVDSASGVSWAVGNWFTVGGSLKWYQVGPSE